MNKNEKDLHEDGFTLEKATQFGIRNVSAFDFHDKIYENLLAGRIGSLRVYPVVSRCSAHHRQVQGSGSQK